MTLVIFPNRPNESFDTDDGYTRWDALGNVVEQRPSLTDSERADVDAFLAQPAVDALVASTRKTLGAGVPDVRAALLAAQGDVPVAQQVQSQIATLTAAAQTQRTALAAFVPSQTYSPGDLATLRDALLAVLDRQIQILQLDAGVADWRVLVDNNAVLIDNALIGLRWLAAQGDS